MKLITILALLFSINPVKAELTGPNDIDSTSPANKSRPGYNQVPTRNDDDRLESDFLEDDNRRGFYDRIQEMEEVDEDEEELKMAPETPTGATGTGQDLSGEDG